MKHHQLKHLRTGLALALAVAAIGVAAQPAAATVTTTGHTGSGAPALAKVGSRLYVAWTGTAGTATAKGLNLGYSTSNGKNIVKITNPEKTPQNEGPALDSDAGGVYLVWPAGNNGNTLTAEYYNGTGFTCRTSFAFLTTNHSPALASDPAGNRYLAWTDTAGHVNIAQLDATTCATSNLMSLRSRQTLSVTSIYGPGLVYDTSGSSNLGWVLSWVVGDASHTVKVASYNGSTTLTNLSQVTTPVGATSGPALTSMDSDLYILFRGSDNNLYVGYSEGCVPTCFGSQNWGSAVTSGIGVVAKGFSDWAYFNAAGNLAFDSLWH